MVGFVFKALYALFDVTNVKLVLIAPVSPFIGSLTLTGVPKADLKTASNLGSTGFDWFPNLDFDGG